MIYGCSQSVNSEPELLLGPFFGLQATDSVKPVAPEIVSSSLFEYNGTFSPDGSEFYYTVSLPGRGLVAFMELKEDNTWTNPAFAVFSGEYSDVDPIFSPDGSKLYFTSTRPFGSTADFKRNNIWFIERLKDRWSSPQVVPLTEAGDYYSSLTNDGSIYFNTWKTGDIYKATTTDSSYLITRLPDIINLDRNVGDPFISPEEDYIIFRDNNPDDGFGFSDLYISFNINQEWTDPENLAEPINSEARESCPYVTSNGLLIFSSTRLIDEYNPNALESLDHYKHKSKSFDNGSWNVYYTSADFIHKLREKHLSK